MRIRTHLVLLAVATLLPVLVVAGWTLDRIRNNERDAALNGLRETVRATALIVDRELQGSLSTLKALGLSEHLVTGNFEAFYAQASAVNRMPDVWTVLLDADGRQVVNTIVPFGTPSPPAVSRERVQQVLRTGKPLITDLLVGSVTGKIVTVVYSPADAGGGKYVLAQSFTVDHWTKSVMMRKLPADWVVAVIDRRGAFIARNQNTQAMLGKQARPELVAAAAAAPEGLIRHHTIEGVEAFDAFAHSQLSGWTVAVAAPVTLIEAPARHALLIAALGTGLAIFLSALAIAIFGRRLTLAIESARRAAVAIGHGSRPAPGAILLGAEMRTLHEALTNAGELLAREHASRQAAEKERGELLQRERAARETAQHQNEAKDRFLAMLGHELRNPLAAISGATALLAMGGELPPRSARGLEIIQRQNRHLSRIVNDLLDVSRLMAGKIVLDAAPMELSGCVRHAIESLQATGVASGHPIEADLAEVWVFGDPVRIEQIVNNLVGNALKFSRPGGPIRVTVAESAGRAVMTVADEGCGMDPALLAEVFEPFVQGPPPENRAATGLGIGLALVRQLVLLHGGDIGAQSEGRAAATGSKFTLWLPVLRDCIEQSAPVANPVKDNLRIVYVEDNDDARTTMAEILRSLGLDVTEVASGEDTLDAVLATSPDAVVLDVGLPGISGLEVARRLRRDARLAGIPLIALTGHGTETDAAAARAAGFDRHLVKPTEARALAAAIEELVVRDPQ
jgi:signal transduction histidine kinase/ActR/RegA family two-component response regulator